MELKNIVNRAYSLYACSALKGENIKEGMEWLVELISQKQENK